MTAHPRRRYTPSPLAEVHRTGSSDRTTIVFTRTLAHPIDAVWSALTDPAQLAQWAPFTADRDLATPGSATLSMIDTNDAGDHQETADLPASVTICEPPSLLEYTWGDDVLRWELTPSTDDQGTELTLRHTLSQPRMDSAVTAGWHICLDVADALLAGDPIGLIVGAEARQHGWDDLNQRYADHLGIERSQV